MSKKMHYIAGALVTVGILALVLVSLFVIAPPLITYAEQPELFRAFVDEHAILSRIVYALMVMLQVLLAVIPGEPIELLGGYAFGAIEGTLLCLAASYIGGVIVFCLVRRFGTHLVYLFFKKEKVRSLSLLQSSPRHTAIFTVLFTLPGTPKDLLCYYAGLTDMPLRLWLVLSLFARIPSIVTSTLLADAIGSGQYLLAILVFGVTILISLLGLLIYYRIIKKSKEAAESKEDCTQL